MRKAIKDRIANPIPRKHRLDKFIAKAVDLSTRPVRKRKVRVQVIPGQPKTTYSEIIATLVCDRIAAGETLKSICKTEGYPSADTVMRWLQSPDESGRPGFVSRYTQAKEVGYMLMAEDIVSIADDSAKDKILIDVKGKPVLVVDLEHIQRDKMRIQARQWTLERVMRDRYGANVKIEHTTSDNLIDRMNAARDRVAKQRETLTIDATAEVLEIIEG